jgi:signal transduction histidine kinase
LYTPSGGRVDVAVKAGEHGIGLVVADNGPGIPEPERAKVFQRFYRGEGTQREGSGLGLAIAHDIARLHGGKISLFQSGMESGLGVRIELPRLPTGS